MLIVTVIAILATFLVQTFTDSMIFGALAGVLIFFVSRAYRWYELDEQFVDGVKLMAYIGVVILTANGFAGVMNATGDIDSLVKSLTGLTGDHKLISIIVMYLIGLIVTLGIGSSFDYTYYRFIIYSFWSINWFRHNGSHCFNWYSKCFR